MTQPTTPEHDPDLIGARKAASVIVLRDAAHGLEVLMLRRAERDGDLRSGVWVFPGGVLDPVDAQLHARADGDDDAQASARLQLPEGGLAYSVAAVRECFEEVGLLFASAGDTAAALQEQARCVTGADFAALCERHALRLDLAALSYHSHWLTPPGIPKRFDTRFYVARLPAGQVPVADQGEAQELAWLSPAAALDPALRLKLLPVTRRTLQDLGRCQTVQAVLDEAAARRHPPRMMPRLGRDARGVRPVLPDEWAWAEIGRLDPAGRGDVHFDLQPLRPVRLSDRVTRLTCDNGSVMTGPGTNTYLVGAPGSGELCVIDPGPDDAGTEAHLQAVLSAAGEARITHILVTHTHKDHSPAALRLAALTGAPVWGQMAAHAEWQDAQFAPTHLPQHGERLRLGAGCTLRALHTPGHASNHLCWLLEEERLLFTGDHVMQGSTVVINPPDGDMGAYLASLQALLDEPLDWFAPGHGFLMAQPHAELQRLIAHRLAREAKVLAALRASGTVPTEALVSTVYSDVPATRHGIALRSLSAHLLKLQADGRAHWDGAGWSAPG
jgi:glyoxylase-like metal-dependent hydrolase (beta-lactamase superfamily II)/8-oxo-dGTP pyrophosphatase MutT (NUDIX family)